MCGWDVWSVSCVPLGCVGLFPVCSWDVWVCFLWSPGIDGTVSCGPQGRLGLFQGPEMLLRAIVSPKVYFAAFKSAIHLSSVAQFVLMLQSRKSTPSEDSGFSLQRPCPTQCDESILGCWLSVLSAVMLIEGCILNESTKETSFLNIMTVLRCLSFVHVP